MPKSELRVSNGARDGLAPRGGDERGDNAKNLRRRESRGMH